MSKTTDDVIKELSDQHPHTYSDEAVAGWISTLDGDISLHLGAAGAPISYSWPQDRGTKLFVQAPFDNVYFLYCLAQIDFLNRDYDQYANTYIMFNARLDEYLKYKARTAADSSSGSGTAGSIGGASISAGENHIIV